MKKFLVCLILLLPFLAIGQRAKEDSADFNASTPYHAVLSHLKYLQDESFYPETAARVLNAESLSATQKKELAVKLKQIFDGLGYYVDVNLIPNKPDFRDTLTGKSRYVVDARLPQVYLEKVGDEWKYSARTVGMISELHAEVYPWGTHKLVYALAHTGSEKYFGLYSWQMIGLLVLVLFSFLLHKFLTWVFEVIIIRLLIRMGQKKIAGRLIKPVAKPFSLLAVAFVLTIFVPVLQLPITVAKYSLLTLRALIPVAGTVVFYKLVDLLTAHLQKLAATTESTLDDQLVPLIRRALKVFVVILGSLFTLQNLNFNITALLAGISIGGLAFALAAQDTLKNLFGSLMIFIDRPFQIGDWVIADKIDGSVEEVGFRSTRVRTFHNSVTYVPNGKMADMTIDNMGMRKYRRFSTKLTITYDTPAELIDVFVQGLERIVLEHPNTWKDNYHVYLNEFGGSSLNILFYIFFEVPDWKGELKAKHEVMLSIVQLAEELGVRFAFPTQTLHMETFPGKESLTPSFENENSASYKKKMEAWFLAKNKGRKVEVKSN